MEIRSAIPVYNSKGDVDAYLAFPNLYNRLGEWIGFVAANREVYSVRGDYVGYLTEEPRILRPRVLDRPHPAATPPPRPPRLLVPPTTPLAPLMRELTYDTVDVLQEEPERLHTRDMGELRPDLD